MKKAFVVLFVLGMLVTTAFPQKPAVVGDNEPGWKRIGQVSASFKRQNESIAVLGADEFSAIKLKVTEAPINIERVQVFYESGDMEELNVRRELQAGAETSTLTLKHPDRDIQKVAFTYKTTPNFKGEKADVELYGLKTDQPKGKDAYREDKAAEDIEREAEEAERDVEKSAERTESDLERAGDEVSETAAKVMADIKDKRHETKVGPNGQVIFISDDSRYYYINNEGNKVFVTEIQLKDKPNKD
jgi:hypothetical protein